MAYWCSVEAKYFSGGASATIVWLGMAMLEDKWEGLLK
jgi:hypothetical protein